MSPAAEALLITTLLGLVPIGVAVAMRLRGPERLVRGVDWSRVRDREAFAQYYSLLMLAIGALIILLGTAEFAAFGNTALEDALWFVFSALIVVLLLARWYVRRRFQTSPDGKR